MLKLNFDIENSKVTEFGVGRRNGNIRTFESVPVNTEVKSELLKYARATLNKMQNQDVIEYDPSDETASSKYVRLPLDSEMARVFAEIQNAENLPKTSDPTNISGGFCYFIHLIDGEHRRLSAVRKITKFSSLGKGFYYWIEGTLKPVSNPLFKLDSMFDLLIDSKYVHILHPKKFESIGNLKQFVLDSVEKNVEIIQENLSFVNTEPIKNYASERVRAARYLASIRMHNWTENIDKNELKRACADNDVKFTESGGLLDVSEDIGGFLEILDRRRYNTKLSAGKSEQFRAASRHKINA